MKAENSNLSVNESFAVIWDETRKKFDDAIYRAKTGDTKTTDQLWVELYEAQESTEEDGRVSALKCTGILNQLAQRGQIPFNW